MSTAHAIASSDKNESAVPFFIASKILIAFSLVIPSIPPESVRSKTLHIFLLLSQCA